MGGQGNRTGLQGTRAARVLETKSSILGGWSGRVAVSHLPLAQLLLLLWRLSLDGNPVDIFAALPGEQIRRRVGQPPHTHSLV